MWHSKRIFNASIYVNVFVFSEIMDQMFLTGRGGVQGSFRATLGVASEIKVKGMSRRVCHGQLVCKVSNSQLSLMQRKSNFDLKTKLRLKK